MKKLLFIKFGGGILTDKKKAYTLNHKFIDLLPKILPPDLLDRYNVILGTGGGSFAHYEAKQAKIPGHVTDRQGRVGVGKTHLAAQKLQSIVAERLLESGWPIFTVSPSDLMDGKRIDISILQHLWRDGLVPLVHGDVIITEQLSQFDIFSTEKIAEVILTECKNKYPKITAIFLTDVTGIVKDGTVLRRIDTKDKLDFDTNSNIDVTGGMAEKVRSAFALAAMDVDVTIASGFETDVIERILNGKLVGTNFDH